MTPREWKFICETVTDEMSNHTKPFVTPLGTETDRDVRLVGSGSYVLHENHRFLLTCEHVARVQPIHYRFHGSEDVFEHGGHWISDKHPIDSAFTLINNDAWEACSHQAQPIPFERLPQRHAPTTPEEILFVRGYAGENARYAFGVHQTNCTGYATQEKQSSGDDQIFEIFWEPECTQLISHPPSDAEQEIKFEDAGGFSGSLVWNTRYLEVTQQGHQWIPEHAVITGILRRWDQDTKTLLAWRVEHLRDWILNQL